MKPTTRDAYRLMHDGTLAHARIEANGIRIDVDQLDKTIEETTGRIDRLTDRLKQDEVWTLWKRRHGQKASIGSRPQLGAVLYGEMGYKPKSFTEGGGKRKPQVDEAALEKIDLPFVRNYLRLERLKKLKSTYLLGVKREVVDGILRPSFNLHLARSFRPSCDSPNFQNIPVRDGAIAKLIRSCIIPRDGHVLAEVDYGGHEWRIAACFWRDEAMVAYASDLSLDIHRDMAAECYLLEPDEVTSSVRFFAKNQFVFPTLYGSYYVNTARNLWSVIASADLTRKDGVPLKEHLAGIWSYPEENGSGGFDGIDDENFEEHIQGVEWRFNERFPTWSRRKEQWWKRYQGRGWFPLMTGFRCSGVYSRNQLFNLPVQGPAFHCLLLSLILLGRRLKERGMRSLIVGQIHDSIVMDVRREELDEVIGMAKQIMTEEVRKLWPWIVTPLLAEVKIGEENWWDMCEVKE